MSSGARKGAKAVASVATATVDGYLRNMSKRLRVPTAEGGRGTRRKMAMVTSAAARASAEAPQDEPVEARNDTAADVDEWDEVELPVALMPVKKQEEAELSGAVKRSVDDEVGGGGVKSELLPKSSAVKAEKAVAVAGGAGVTGSGFVKSELVNVDDEEAAVDGRSLMEGAQLPLVGQPRASETWRQRDPAYEAMMEQRDLLAAKRRSERIQRVCEHLFTILAVFIRARLLWRESCHPRLAKRLLRLHVPCERGAKRQRREGVYFGGSSRFVFLRAVAAAKVLAAEASQPQWRKLSLAPAWVTCGKDAVRNKTSAAVTSLLNAINEHFKLAVAEAPDKPDGSAAAGDGAAASSPVWRDFSDWAAPIAPRLLRARMAEVHGRVSKEAPLLLPHPLYFSVVFLTLARLAGLSCRLVVARLAKSPLDKARAAAATAARQAAGVEAGGDGDGERDAAEGEADEEESESGSRTPFRPLSIHGPRGKKSADSGASQPGAKRPRSSAKSANGAGEGEELKSKKLPTSCYWVEVWSPERESFLSVNPCQGCATLWGAPYTFSVSGTTVVDATPRYISKYSAAYNYGRRLGKCQQNRFLWHDELAWDDNRELPEVLRASFDVAAAHTSALAQRQREREGRQLHSLMYSEAVPTTLNALHSHPLYVIETDLARHEGIYPKDTTTTVGSIKGHMVYKRSAIVSLRSRDGWLREGRSLLSEDQPAYKTVAPPASRPFVAPSAFYGRWQTQPFAPLPLTPGDPPSIPHHGRTSWYILLDKAAPAGIVHLTQPQITRVARRMKLDFGLAVVGFQHRRTEEHRRGRWETVINGIVVKQTDSAALLRAYEEWVQLVQEQEAAKRRQRSFHWWLLLAQRLLSMKRLQDQYAKGFAAGAMPVQ